MEGVFFWVHLSRKVPCRRWGHLEVPWVGEGAIIPTCRTSRGPGSKGDFCLCLSRGHRGHKNPGIRQVGSRLEEVKEEWVRYPGELRGCPLAFLGLPSPRC